MICSLKKKEMRVNPDVESLTVFKKYSESKEYKNYRQMWKKYPQKHIVSEYPLHVDCELNAKCNLFCGFCPRQHYRKNDRGRMPFEVYKKIFNYGVPKAMKWNWLNESLLDKRLPMFISYAKKMGVIDAIINTNGTILTKKKSMALIQSGVDKIIFSIDSIKRETYEKLRPHANFDDVIKNIQNLIRLKGNDKPIIRISRVALPEVLEEDAVSFWKSIGVDEYMSTMFVNHSKNIIKNRRKSCASIYQRLLVDYTGSVHPCCVDYGSKYVLGNIKNQSIYDMWHGDKMQKLRELSKQGRLNTLELCRWCSE